MLYFFKLFGLMSLRIGNRWIHKYTAVHYSVYYDIQSPKCNSASYTGKFNTHSTVILNSHTTFGKSFKWTHLVWNPVLLGSWQIMIPSVWHHSLLTSSTLVNESVWVQDPQLPSQSQVSLCEHPTKFCL